MFTEEEKKEIFKEFSSIESLGDLLKEVEQKHEDGIGAVGVIELAITSACGDLGIQSEEFSKMFWLRILTVYVLENPEKLKPLTDMLKSFGKEAMETFKTDFDKWIACVHRVN